MDSLRLLRPLILWSESVQELFHQAESDLKEALKVIADRHLAGSDKAEALAQAVIRYYGQLFQLQSEEVGAPLSVPSSRSIELIKVAFNVIEDCWLMLLELQTRFPLAHADILQLRAQWTVRKTLFPEVPESIEMSTSVRSKAAWRRPFIWKKAGPGCSRRPFNFWARVQATTRSRF